MATFGFSDPIGPEGNFIFPSSDVDYTGLVDTTTSFTGGNYGAGDVLLGSPVPLGTDFPFPEGTVNDYGLEAYKSDFTNTFDSGSLGATSGMVFGTAGVDDYGHPLSASYANVNPRNSAVSSPTDAPTWAAFTSLSKIGSSFATLFGAHPSTVNPNATPASSISRGNALGQGVQVGGVTGTNTVLLVIVVGAVILLLLHSKGE